MNFAQLANTATRMFHGFGFKLKQHSPEIIIGASIVGTVASTILACKATTKVSAVLEEAHENIEKIHEVEASEEFANYTPEDAKKDLTITYVQTGLKIAKLYAPAVILGGLSITGFITSNGILKKRNLALAAAYTAVDKGFKEYRGRVVERFGEDLDKELRYNLKAKEVEIVDVKEDGTEEKTKETVLVSDGALANPYARFFDETCYAWEKDAELNLMFLNQQQNWANDKLRSKGHLFLNEVYEALGMQKSKAGQIVGWVYDEKHPVGSNYVDFGIYNINRENSRLFVNGYERSILLDFNVDGNILEYLSA